MGARSCHPAKILYKEKGDALFLEDYYSPTEAGLRIYNKN